MIFKPSYCSNDRQGWIIVQSTQIILKQFLHTPRLLLELFS